MPHDDAQLAELSPERPVVEEGNADGGIGLGLRADAVVQFLDRLVEPVAEVEQVAVFDALDRILAQDIVSPISVPPHDNSAMDGYAFDGAALQADRSLSLQVVGTALAAPVPAQSQGEAVDPPGRVGRLSEVQGQVWLYHPGEGEWIAAERNRPLTAGDRVATDGDGRAEIRVGSTTLRVDRGSEFEVLRLLVQGRTLDEIGQHLFLSPKTISNYQSSIRQRLGAGTAVEVMRYAQKHRLFGP